MSENDLSNRVLGWISTQGYPLEFQVANIFRQNKFVADQGHYVPDFKTDLPREIDVLADDTVNNEDFFLRISFVVECKWSGDKPWVIFSDPSSRISSPACIAQSIGTKTAEAIMWLLAADDEVQKLRLFHTPERPGFGGRQAFSAQNDLVYATLQSVISASYSLRKDYEVYEKNIQETLSFGTLIIPIIVIDGKLFETYYDLESSEMQVNEEKMLRLHWRGAEAWSLHSTIDIVTIDSLGDYVRNLKVETTNLLSKMENMLINLKAGIEENSFEPLKGYLNVSRGILGMPSLLQNIDPSRY